MVVTNQMKIFLVESTPFVEKIIVSLHHTDSFIAQENQILCDQVFSL